MRLVGDGRWLYKVFPRGIISTSPPLINGVVMRFVGGELVWCRRILWGVSEVWKWNSPQEIANRRSCFMWNIAPHYPLILDNIIWWGIPVRIPCPYLKGGNYPRAIGFIPRRDVFLDSSHPQYYHNNTAIFI